MKPGGTAHQHYYLARVGLGHLTVLVLKFLNTEMKITFQIPIETWVRTGINNRNARIM